MENPLEKPEATAEDPDPKPRPSPETPYPTTICKAGLSQVHVQSLSVPGTLDSPSNFMLLQDWEGSLLPKRTDTIMLIPGTKDVSKAGWPRAPTGGRLVVDCFISKPRFCLYCLSLSSISSLRQ